MNNIVLDYSSFVKIILSMNKLWKLTSLSPITGIGFLENKNKD